jgi:3-phosphoshikimate 1-carboxyvinyltransferase
MVDKTVHPPAQPFTAVASVPGDKSLSHRSLILAAMADGRSEVSGLGPGLDVASTLAAVQALGAIWDGTILTSAGVAGWREPAAPIDCGNSGTTMRMLAGALCGRAFAVELIGDDSLSRRPMERVAGPLRTLGATVEVAPGGTAPIRVCGGPLRGAAVRVDGASAQVRSAFELAAIQAEGESLISGPTGYRDHTERMLESFGLGERTGAGEFRVVPGAVPPCRYQVPGDPSSAAFLWAAAALLPGSEVKTPAVSLNPGRLGLLQALEAMGASVTAEVTGTFHGDVVGDVTVCGRGLRAVTVEADEVAPMIDELPLLAVLAACGEGTTMVRGAGELRSKESDRIATTVAMIRALGGSAQESDDGFIVVGTGRLAEGVVDSHGDHRIAMAAAVAATAATGPVTVTAAEAASVSWPGFYEALEEMWSSR